MRRPSRQGEFDGLCGYYVTINSAKRVAWLTNNECEDLSATLQPLLNTVDVWKGCDVHKIEELLEAAVEFCNNARPAYVFRCTKLKGLTGKSFKALLTKELERGCVFVVGVSGKIDHWTVVTEATKNTLRIFDSSNDPNDTWNWKWDYVQFERNKILLPAAKSGAERYWINLDEVFRFWKVRKTKKTIKKTTKKSTKRTRSE